MKKLLLTVLTALLFVAGCGDKDDINPDWHRTLISTVFLGNVEHLIRSDYGFFNPGCVQLIRYTDDDGKVKAERLEFSRFACQGGNNPFDLSSLVARLKLNGMEFHGGDSGKPFGSFQEVSGFGGNYLQVESLCKYTVNPADAAKYGPNCQVQISNGDIVAIQ